MHYNVRNLVRVPFQGCTNCRLIGPAEWAFEISELEDLHRSGRITDDGSGSAEVFPALNVLGRSDSIGVPASGLVGGELSMNCDEGQRQCGCSQER